MTRSFNSRSRFALCGTAATVALLILTLTLGWVPGVHAQENEAGNLVLRVMLISAELSVVPVPKQRFEIIPEDAESVTLSVTTGFDGQVDTRLPRGRYRVRAEIPIDFEGKRYSWDIEFEIRTGAATSVELSNDNASAKPLSAAVSKEADIYRRFNDGVFKVITDSGHGTGFLVDESGLVLTNHHVIADADYLAIKIDETHKFQALLVAQDVQHDVAVLRLHPEMVRDRPVLVLADDNREHAAVTVGESVVAIGSPLTTETILTSGLVSKVESEAFYSDVNINPGNSGGPLFNANGHVVGISTFGLQAETGPGVSGITRIYLVGDVLDEARRSIGESAPPSSRPLPIEDLYRLSPETVHAMALETYSDPIDYDIEAGKIDIRFITSTSRAREIVSADRQAQKAAEKRKRKRQKKSGAEITPDEEFESPNGRFYEWQKDSDNFRPVVFIRAFPEVKMSLGSAFVVAAIGTGGKYRFKTDFERMELRRDGQLVEPIHPGRIREVVNASGGGGSMHDVGYWGLYEYAPEAFAPGAVVSLHVWESDVPEGAVLNLNSELLQSIRNDLKPYFDFKAVDSPGQ